MSRLIVSTEWPSIFLNVKIASWQFYFVKVPRNENIPRVFVSSDFPNFSFHQSAYKNSTDDHKSFKSVRETGRVSDYVAKSLIQSHERLSRRRRRSLLQLSKITRSDLKAGKKPSREELEKVACLENSEKIRNLD